MKYVLIVIFLSVGSGGDYSQDDEAMFKTHFTIEYPSREKCMAALEETEHSLMSRENVRAVTVECRPRLAWDTPITKAEFDRRYGDDRLAKN